MSKFLSFIQNFCRNTYKQYRKLLLIQIIGFKVYSLKKYINYNNGYRYVKYPLIVLQAQNTNNDMSCASKTENNIQIVIAMAESALANGYIQEAETIFLVALQLAEVNKMDVHTNYIYDRLINISYIMGDYVNAETLINQVIERLTNNGVAADDDTIIKYRLKLARVYSFMSNVQAAEKTFKECIAIQKQKLASGNIKEKTDILLINLYFWYGVLLYQQQRYQDALTNIEAAYLYTDKVKQIQPAQELVLLSILAEINTVLNNFDKAIVYLNDAIKIGKTINHPELAFCYVMLGNIYIMKKMYNEALSWCEEGQKLSKQQRNKTAQQASEACLKRIKQTFDDKYQSDQKQA